MFRSYDLRFLVPYAILLLALTGLVIWYEVAYKAEDSWTDTIKAIGEGMSSAVSVTFIIFATVEGTAYMVLALMRLRKLKEENAEKLEEGLQKGLERGREQGLEQGREQGLKQGRQEERKRWEAWLQRSEEARAAGLPFDEPPPSQENQREDNGQQAQGESSAISE